MNEVYAGKHHFILYQTTQISIHNFSNNVTIMDKIFETNPSFHVQYSATEKSAISIFQQTFAGIVKIFILEGILSTRL